MSAIGNKFGDDRRTEIVNVSGEVDIEDLIPNENCVFTLTTLGYIKRQSVDTYQTQHRGGRGVKGMTRREEDVAETMFTCSTHDYIMFFTSEGKVYRLKGYEIPEGSRNSKGMNIVNILPLGADEKVTAMIRVPEFGTEKLYLCMLTKTALSSVPSLTHIRTSAKRYIRDKSRRGRRIEICKAHRRRKADTHSYKEGYVHKL